MKKIRSVTIETMDGKFQTYHGLGSAAVRDTQTPVDGGKPQPVKYAQIHLLIDNPPPVKGILVNSVEDEGEPIIESSAVSE